MDDRNVRARAVLLEQCLAWYSEQTMLSRKLHAQAKRTEVFKRRKI